MQRNWQLHLTVTRVIFLCICNYSIISSNNPSVFIQSLDQKNSFYNEENLRFKFEIQDLSNIEKISPINETTIFFTDVKDIHNTLNKEINRKLDFKIFNILGMNFACKNIFK